MAPDGGVSRLPAAAAAAENAQITSRGSKPSGSLGPEALLGQRAGLSPSADSDGRGGKAGWPSFPLALSRLLSARDDQLPPPPSTPVLLPFLLQLAACIIRWRPARCVTRAAARQLADSAHSAQLPFVTAKLPSKGYAPPARPLPSAFLIDCHEPSRAMSPACRGMKPDLPQP